MASENDVISTVTLRHLYQFWRVMVRNNVRKELFPRLKGVFPLGKLPFLFPFKITKNSIRNVESFMLCFFLTHVVRSV